MTSTASPVTGEWEVGDFLHLGPSDRIPAWDGQPCEIVGISDETVTLIAVVDAGPRSYVDCDIFSIDVLERAERTERSGLEVDLRTRR